MDKDRIEKCEEILKELHKYLQGGDLHYSMPAVVSGMITVLEEVIFEIKSESKHRPIIGIEDPFYKGGS